MPVCCSAVRQEEAYRPTGGYVAYSDDTYECRVCDYVASGYYTTIHESVYLANSTSNTTLTQYKEITIRNRPTHPVNRLAINGARSIIIIKTLS